MGLLTFELGSLPLKVQVYSAELRLHVRPRSATQLVWGEPTALGAIRLEHASFIKPTTAEWEAGPFPPDCYTDQALLQTMGVLVPAGTIVAENQEFVANVTGAVTNDVVYRQGRLDRSQFRLRLDKLSDNDAEDDQLMFWNRATSYCDDPKTPCFDREIQIPVLRIAYRAY
jgi:hypothetical protein